MYLLAESCCTVCFCNLHCLHCEREQRHAFCYLPLRHLFRFCCCISDYHRRMKRELIYADRLSPTPASSAFCNTKIRSSANEAIYHEEQTTGVFFLLFIYFFFVFVNSLCAMLLSFFSLRKYFLPSLQFTIYGNNSFVSLCCAARMSVLYTVHTQW